MCVREKMRKIRKKMRKTRSGKGVYTRNDEIVYVASIRSMEAFLQGEQEYVAFAKFPYREIPNEDERNMIYTYCSQCEGMCMFKEVGKDKWRCAGCGTERTTTELIQKMRSMLEAD